MTRILVASGGHKHLLGPTRVCEAIRDGLLAVDGGLEVALSPMADGGDGTMEALVRAHGGRVINAATHDPLFRPRTAVLGLYTDTDGVPTAVLEIAEAAGSALLAPHERQTMVATSYGVGELLLRARDAGSERIVVGLGGSIVSDMGMGMAQALGVVFLDAWGAPLSPVPGGGFNALSMDQVADVRLPRVPLLPGVEVVVASDAAIPLLGPGGQAASFGPQKGAGPEEIAYMEKGFANLSAVVERVCGRPVDVPYAGAAGGLGSALVGFCGASLRPGAALVAESIGLDEFIRKHDLVITGEGLHDATTSLGKTPCHVAERAGALGVPVAAVVGAVAPGADQWKYDRLVAGGHGLERGPSADEAEAGLRRAASELASGLDDLLAQRRTHAAS